MHDSITSPPPEAAGPVEAPALNPAMAIEVVPIGKERRPVVVIDGLLRDPDALVAFASKGPDWQANKRDYYPGLRKLLPPAYGELLCNGLADLLWNVFRPPSGLRPRVELSALSLTTTSPERLRPIQRLPHFDHSHRDQFAVLHYLCDEAHGGTGFYRHRASGHETVTETRLADYAARLKQEVTGAHPPPPGYLSGSGALFEEIARFPARFNRALIYPGNLLHSGLIDPRIDLHPDPRRGRLTVNTFIRFR